MKKKVYQNPPEQKIALAISADDNRYYGVQGNLGGVMYGKGFIARNDYNRGTFDVLALSSLTKHNTFPAFRQREETTNLPLFIQTVLNFGAEVYQFDTYQELFQWLIDKD
jgi:hypothetical protein